MSKITPNIGLITVALAFIVASAFNYTIYLYSEETVNRDICYTWAAMAIVTFAFSYRKN